MRKILIADANIHQLRKYGEEELGLQFAPNTSRTVMMAQINVVDPSGLVPVDDEPLVPHEAAASPSAFDKRFGNRSIATGESMKTDPHVILLIPKEEKPGGDEPVPVGVNGKVMYIPRATVCEIPYRFYLALTLANRIIWRQTDDAGNREPSETPAYPMNVMHLPTAEEVENWERRTSGQQLEAA